MGKHIKVNVGIDISMQTFWATVTVLDNNHELYHLSSKEFENTESGHKQVLIWATQIANTATPLHFTMEATGVYYENLAHYLHTENGLVHVILPNKVKRYAESLDNRSKTDKIDSMTLGQYGAERKLSIWRPALPEYSQLKALTRERSKYIKMRTVAKNTLHATNHSHQPNKKIVERLDELIKSFDLLLISIENEIKETISSESGLKQKVETLTTVPGVGEITAATIIGETNGFSQIENSRQLCSYSGLDVKVRESGKWKGQSRISKKGNSHIRAALYFPALSTVRHSQQMGTFYQRIKDKKSKSKIALTAVSRKMLVLMYSLWKSGQKYEEGHLSNAA